MINADPGQFPPTFGAILARWAWRYRSELSPLAVAAGLAVAGSWAHVKFASWWEVILAGFSVAAWLSGTFGVRIGLSTYAERVYAATATFMAGAWLATAAKLGRLHPRFRKR